jgi:hypothetical protein
MFRLTGLVYRLTIIWFHDIFRCCPILQTRESAGRTIIINTIVIIDHVDWMKRWIACSYIYCMMND